jgi:hypothetical protein
MASQTHSHNLFSKDVDRPGVATRGAAQLLGKRRDTLHNGV